MGGEGRGGSRILSTKAAAVASVRMVHFRAEYEYVSNHNQEHRSRFPQITGSREAAILGTVYSNWSKESPKVKYAFQTHWMHQVARQQLHGEWWEGSAIGFRNI